MKTKTAIIFALILCASLSRATTLNWGSGTSVLKKELPLTSNLTGVLVELYFGTFDSGTLIDSTHSSAVAGYKGTFASTVEYDENTYTAGTSFYMLVYDTADNSGQYMLVSANGTNQLNPTYYWLTTGGTQTLALSDVGYPQEIPWPNLAGDGQIYIDVPEPGTMALLALGIAVIAIRRNL